MYTELENDNLAEIIASNPKTIVQFSAGWCGNCKIMKPKFKKSISISDVDEDLVEPLQEQLNKTLSMFRKFNKY